MSSTDHVALLGAAESLLEKGYAIWSPDATLEKELVSLCNTSGASFGRLPQLQALRPGSSAGETVVGFCKDGASLPSFTFRAGGLTASSLEAQKRPARRFIAKQERVYDQLSRFALRFLYTMGGIDATSAKRCSALVLQTEKGLKPASGGGPDGAASLTSLCVRSIDGGAQSTDSEERVDYSLLTMVVVPASTKSPLQLWDKKTLRMVTPQLNDGSYGANRSSKLKIVIFPGHLFDVAWGGGTGEFSTLYQWSTPAASTSHTAGASAHAAAGAGTDDPGAVRGAPTAVLDSRFALVFRVLPHKNSELDLARASKADSLWNTTTGGGPSKRCGDVVRAFHGIKDSWLGPQEVAAPPAFSFIAADNDDDDDDEEATATVAMSPAARNSTTATASARDSTADRDGNEPIAVDAELSPTTATATGRTATMSTSATVSTSSTGEVPQKSPYGADIAPAPPSAVAGAGAVFTAGGAAALGNGMQDVFFPGAPRPVPMPGAVGSAPLPAPGSFVPPPAVAQFPFAPTPFGTAGSGAPVYRPPYAYGPIPHYSPYPPYGAPLPYGAGAMPSYPPRFPPGAAVAGFPPGALPLAVGGGGGWGPVPPPAGGSIPPGTLMLPLVGCIGSSKESISFYVRKFEGGPVAPVTATVDRSIHHVALKLAQDLRLPAGCFFLYRDNKLLGDSALVAESGIKPGDLLEMREGRLRVVLERPDGTTAPLDIETTDTISGVVTRIHRRKLAPMHCDYVYAGGVLLAADQSVKHYGITPGARLEVRAGALKVKIKLPPGVARLHVNIQPQAGRLELFMRPEDTLGDLKTKIVAWVSVSPSRVFLSLGNQWLGPELDRKPLSSFGLDDALALLVLSDGAVSLILRDLDAKDTVVNVHCDDTVRRVKEWVFRFAGIPVASQFLYHRGAYLADNVTLRQCNIVSANIVGFHVPKMRVYVKTGGRSNGDGDGHEGTKTLVLANPTDTLALYKKRIVSLCPSVDDTGFLVCGDRWLLNDDSWLEANGIRGGETLHLEPGPIVVTVEVNGVESVDSTTLELRCHPEESLNSLRTKVKARAGLPGKAFLKRDGKWLPFDEQAPGYAATTLTDLGIGDGSVLQAFDSKASVIVKPSTGDLFIVEASLDGTLSELKQKIRLDPGVPLIEQSLAFEGRCFDARRCDGAKLLQLGITDGSTVQLSYGTMRVLYKDSETAAAVPVMVTTADKLQDVKAKVESQIKTPLGPGLLTFEGRFLCPSTRVSSYGLQKGCELVFAPAGTTFTLSVDAPGGKSVPLEVNPTETVEQVKGKVEAAEGLRAAEHVIFFEGQRLEDAATLVSCDVQRGSSLQLRRKSATA